MGTYVIKRAILYLALQRRREVMDKKDTYKSWDALIDDTLSRPKSWKIYTKKISTPFEGWDTKKHGHFPSEGWNFSRFSSYFHCCIISGLRMFWCTLPSANRSDKNP